MPIEFTKLVELTLKMGYSFLTYVRNIQLFKTFVKYFYNLWYNFFMGRDKIKRNYNFKPKYKEFKAINCDNCTTIHLLHEEMEALYLMDNLGLYQADAAKKMGVSRPTIARIIKNARQKVATFLITGATLKIEDEKEDYIVAIASTSNKEIILGEPNSNYIYILHINQEKIADKRILQNPAITQNMRPGQVLPQMLNGLNVNYFLSTSIGSGLKEALKAKGIFSYIYKEFRESVLFELN